MQKDKAISRKGFASIFMGTGVGVALIGLLLYFVNIRAIYDLPIYLMLIGAAFSFTG